MSYQIKSVRWSTIAGTPNLEEQKKKAIWEEIEVSSPSINKVSKDKNVENKKLLWKPVEFAGGKNTERGWLVGWGVFITDLCHSPLEW